jgi:hypothetical protein
VIVARPDVASDDFAQAGYLAAKVGKSDLGDSIFGQEEVVFQRTPTCMSTKVGNVESSSQH